MSQEDKAQEQELMQWERNQSRPAPVRYAPGDAGYGPAECEYCDADMPAARREHGFTVCVDCKTKLEARERNSRQ